MPTIPSMSLSGAEISAKDVYESGLFKPSSTPSSLEILNGGLDYPNIGFADGSVEPYAWQMGSFAVGLQTGFERYEFAYARQMGGDAASGSDTQYQSVTHAGLSKRIFIPWSASILIYGYQAFFHHDATLWDVSGTPEVENWIVRFHHNGVEAAHAEARLPPSRGTTGTSAAFSADASSGGPGYAREDSWRYVSKSKTETDVDKGYHHFHVTLSADVKQNDPSRAKCKTVIGAFWVLAIR